MGDNSIMKEQSERELCLEDVAEGRYIDYAHAQLGMPLTKVAMELSNVLDSFASSKVLESSINSHSVEDIQDYIKLTKAFVKRTKLFQKPLKKTKG